MSEKEYTTQAKKAALEHGELQDLRSLAQLEHPQPVAALRQGSVLGQEGVALALGQRRARAQAPARDGSVAGRSRRPSPPAGSHRCLRGR